MKKKIILIFSLFICSLSLFLITNKSSDAMQLVNKSNIKYSDKSSRLLLDIVYPQSNTAKKLPVVLYLHGGSYINGDKERYKESNIKYFANSGFAYVSLNYRLSNESTFPSAVNDVKTAIRFLKSKSDEFNIDSNQIYILGQSAGANLATLVLSTEGTESLNGEEIEYREYDSKVSGAILTSGFYDLNSLQLDVRGNDVKKTYINIKKQFNSNKIVNCVIDANNTYTYASMIKKPILIMHNIGDPLISANQSIDFYNKVKMTSNNKDITLVINNDNVHSASSFYKKSVSVQIKDWINDRVK